MSGDIQYELYLNEYKAEALEAVLKTDGTSIEQQMQERLAALYTERVPLEVQREIQQRLDVEHADDERETEARRKYTVFHVKENGAGEYFWLDRGMEFLDAALVLRNHLRQPEGSAGSFAERFQSREKISAGEFDRMVGVRMENTGKVVGAFELDFDKREFSAVHIMDGWKTFAMKDVSTAAYHAFRKAGLSTDERWRRFLSDLEDREITSAGHLSAREISFADEIYGDDNLLNFYMETNFDVDAVFGTSICTEENDDWMNVYANYNMVSGQICDELEANLVYADGREESLTYTLNAAEKDVLLRKMEEYCQERTGMSLQEYSAQIMAEDMEPPTGPVM